MAPVRALWRRYEPDRHRGRSNLGATRPPSCQRRGAPLFGRSPPRPSSPGDNLLATIGLTARRVGVGDFFARGFLAHDRQVVRAIDGEAILLSVLIEEEQEHEQVSQNDRDYGNHSPISLSLHTLRRFGVG